MDPEPIPETLTALGGVPLVVQTFRSLGLPAKVREQVRIKERERGYDEATMVESFAVLNAVGGECFEDFKRLREDPGLSELIGHGIPPPEVARKLLYQFHEEEKIEAAKQRRSGDEIAYVPEEAEPLVGLGLVNRALVQELGQRCPEQRIATVDQDATIIESHKQEALRTHEGERGYQPMLAVWAEMNVVLADEFRDGNVPATREPLGVARQAFAALPETVTTYYYRGDSACHESGLITFGGDSRMRGSEFRARREVRAQGHATAALHRDPDSAAPGEPVCRRRQGETFRGGDEHSGLEGEPADRMAPGESGND